MNPPNSRSLRDHDVAYHRVSRPDQSGQNPAIAQRAKIFSRKLLREIAFSKVQIIIYGGYLLAVALAVGNFLFFQWLDTQLVRESIPQTYVSNIANALVRLFSISLGLASSTAFTQILWRQLRQKCLKVSTIDGLLSVPTAATELLSWDILQVATKLWFFGLILQLIPLATIFPPGSIIVLPRLVSRTENMSVPIFDVRFRGNGSLYDLYENALFQQYVDGRYTRPGDTASAIAKTTLLNGRLLTSNSPCGLNCSYTIQFDGPDFECSKGSWPGLEESAQDLFDTDGSVQPPPKQENTKRDSSRPGSFWAAPLNKDGKFYFAVNYDTGNNSLTAHLNTICTYFASTYHMNLNFVNGTEIVDIEVKKKYPLNATALDWAYLFAPYDVVDNKSSEGMATILPDDLVLFTGMGGGPKLPISDAFRDSNIRAIADGVSYALGGILLRAGSEAAIHMNTLIQETPWVKSYKRLDWTSYDFSQLTPALYEKMLRNVTMSMLSRPNTNTTVEVTMSPWENAYSFASRQSLIWPYGVSLVMSAGFIALGIVALGQNGVPADSGGFMQLLCTTTGDNLAINKEAAKCSMGGSPNFSNELKELRVRFGYIKATAEDEGKPRAGFGTEEETDAI